MKYLTPIVTGAIVLALGALALALDARADTAQAQQDATVAAARADHLAWLRRAVAGRRGPALHHADLSTGPTTAATYPPTAHPTHRRPQPLGGLSAKTSPRQTTSSSDLPRSVA